MTITTSTRLFTATGRFYWNEEGQQWLPNPEKPPRPLEARMVAEFNPDRNGFSDWIVIKEMQDKMPAHASQLGGNGSTLFQSSGLHQDFWSACLKPNNALIVATGSRIDALTASTKAGKRNSQSAKTSEEVLSGFCAALGTRSKKNLEVDHKDGRKDSYIVNDVNLQRLEDFQALHKTANDVKREVCKKCNLTNQRFDATHLGFPAAGQRVVLSTTAPAEVASGTTRLPSVQPWLALRRFEEVL